MMLWMQAGRPTEALAQISAPQLAEWLADPSESATILDVREPGEWGAGFIPHSLRIPLGELTERFSELPRAQWTFVHCQSGYRSAIASSLLRRAGFERVVNVSGGFNAWKSAGLPVGTPKRIWM